MDCNEPQDAKPAADEEAKVSQETASDVTVPQIAQSTPATDGPAATSDRPAGDTAPARLLQAMALWVEGAGDPTRDGEGVLSGWSARYAANFDREDELPKPDLAPVLGLPEGTSAEELFKAAEEQEEDLIKQLIS